MPDFVIVVPLALTRTLPPVVMESHRARPKAHASWLNTTRGRNVVRHHAPIIACVAHHRGCRRKVRQGRWGMTATILVVDDEPDLEALVQQKFRRQIRDGVVQFMFALEGIAALSAVGDNL